MLAQHCDVAHTSPDQAPEGQIVVRAHQRIPADPLVGAHRGADRDLAQPSGNQLEHRLRRGRWACAPLWRPRRHLSRDPVPPVASISYRPGKIGPESRYPDIVYSWSNWLFACHDCNHAKGEKWPPRGYADPCARSRGARPEHFFSFDILTGEILPKEGLSRARRRKAQRTIDELRLNEWHHLKNRLEWIQLISAIIPDEPAEMTAESEEQRAHFVSRTTPYSSVTRRWLSERGHRSD